MKPIITIISESGSSNLGDQAIAQAISTYLSDFFEVRLFPFSTSWPSQDQKNHPKKKTSRSKVLLKTLIGVMPVRLRARVRWYLLGERRKYYRLVKSEIVESSAILIGGGQLIKNNTALFCDRLAVIAKVADRRDVPYFFVGVGVDRKMSFLTWKIVGNAMAKAKMMLLRDSQSMNLISSQYQELMSCDIIPDLAFALGNGKAFPPSRDTEYAINVMSVPLMIDALPKSLKLSVVDIRDMWFAISKQLAERGALPVIFTTGSREDLREAQDLQIRLRAKADISVDLIHPASVKELQSLLSRSRNVLASRMHAGILAHISGCNTLCLNWDEKVKGVWTTAGEESRVVEIESLIGPKGAACLQQRFAESCGPTVEQVSEVSRIIQARLRAELSYGI